MSRRRKVLIPMPRTKFLKVKCPSCGNEQVVFDRTTFPVRCLICGTQLIYPTGAKARLAGEVV
ncbi:MAG: 30S ribosomal protein S27e, partial [Zestosphaera sp.]